MSLRNLPETKAPARPKNFQWDPPGDVLAKWADQPLAAVDEDTNTITIFDVIGEDFWTGGGFTAKAMAAALNDIGKNDVTVKINSPGGDVFEGLAIYNLLREHPAKVSVDVMGLAASAASFIAMAGDEINMHLGTFMMVHNAWGLVVGNRHDMRDAADTFDGFDGAITDIYEARTGLKRGDIEALMDKETWLGAADAVEKGFADSVDDTPSESDAKNELPTEIHARRRLDALLAKQGMPRTERRQLMREVATGMQDAAPPATQDAGPDPVAMRQLIETIKSI